MNSNRSLSPLFFLLIFAIFQPRLLRAGNLPPGFSEIRIATGLDPVAMAIAPDGRLFFTEKFGFIRVVKNGQLLPDPFLIQEVDDTYERGMAGIAFDPDFEQNHYVYLFYTVKGANHNRLSRFTADGDLAVPGSEVTLIDFDPLTDNFHNSGALLFGSDGKLYISTGEGWHAPNSQDFGNLLGKILRINKDGSIPEDNPFYNTATGRNRAIWALGLRNPFSMTMQPGADRLFVCDVGAATWEEVNEIIKGKNYGWPLTEGYLQAGQTAPENYAEPLHAYLHNTACAAVGAAFYNPQTVMFPQEYVGKFFFGEYCNGDILMLDPNSGQVDTFATGLEQPTALLTAPDGTMYYLERGSPASSGYPGSLWRIFYTGNGAPFISIQPESKYLSVGESTTFSVASSGNAPLQYRWQKNGADIAGATAASYTSTNSMLSDSGSLFRCIVVNASGADTSQSAQLRVTANHRPQAHIVEPEEGWRWRAGETLYFTGEGSDTEDGALPPSAMQWKIDFHHDAHLHPAFVPADSIDGGEFFIPTGGEIDPDIWFRVYLEVTDQNGLSHTSTRDVFPRKSLIRLRSEPPGAPFEINYSRVNTPYTVVTVVGKDRQVQAYSSWITGDSVWLFQHWENGDENRFYAFAAPDDTLTFNAIYTPHPLDDGTGLQGYYYKMRDAIFEYPDSSVFSRLDHPIDFYWQEGGADDEPLLHNGKSLERWVGYVKPLFDETLNFHIWADDGIRLWVNDSLLVEDWVPQPAVERSGSLDLKAGVKYPILIEKFDWDPPATCRLRWSSEKLTKTIIPSSQLYPALLENAFPFDETNVQAYPNPFKDELTIELELPTGRPFRLELYNMLGVRVLETTQKMDAFRTKLQVNFMGEFLPPGLYFMRVSEGEDSVTWKVIKH